MRFHAGPLWPRSLSLFLLLLCSASRSASRSVPRSVPGSRDAPGLELIEHVLNNDQYWRPVLNQGIRLTNRNRPPYHREDDPAVADPEVRALLRLVDPDVTEVTPLPVLRKVAELRWLGSYVEYGAYVTRTAFMCYTYTNVALIVDLVIIMWDKSSAAAPPAQGDAGGAEAVANAVPDGFPEHAIRDAMAVVSQFVAKMAAVHSDLTTMADLLFENASAAPATQYQSLRFVHDMVDEQINERCVKSAGRNDAFLNLGFSAAHGSLESPATKLEVVVNTFDRTVEKALHVYEDFNVDVMPLENWRPVLDYVTPVEKCADPYINILPETDLFEKLTDSRARAKYLKQLK